MKEAAQYFVFGVFGLMGIACLWIMALGFMAAPRGDKWVMVGAVIFSVLFATLVTWAFG